MTDPNNFAYNNLLSKFQTLDSQNNVKKVGKKKRTKSPKKQMNNSDTNDDYNNSNGNDQEIEDNQTTESITIDATNTDTTVNDNDNDNNNENGNNDDIPISNNIDNDNENNINTNDNDSPNSGMNITENSESNDKSTNEETKVSMEEVTNSTQNDDEDDYDVDSNNSKDLTDKDSNMATDHNSGQNSTIINEPLSIEKWLQNNKLYNSELLIILKSNHIDTEDDLKEYFTEGDDLAGMIKSVRKRTEKVCAGFSKKIVNITGIDYEYKPPRHRAKESNLSSTSSKQNVGLLGARSNSGRASSPRGRSYSNSSQGSSGQIGDYTYRKHKGRPTPTGKEIDTNAKAKNSQELREWLKRKNIFHKELFDFLAAHGYYSPDDLEELSIKAFDKLVREVRVETFKDVNSSAKRNRVDKLLVKFETEWRNLSGQRKTNMTKEQQEQWGYTPRTASQRRAAEQGYDDVEDDGFFNE